MTSKLGQGQRGPRRVTLRPAANPVASDNIYDLTQDAEFIRAEQAVFSEAANVEEVLDQAEMAAFDESEELGLEDNCVSPAILELEEQILANSGWDTGLIQPGYEGLKRVDDQDFKQFLGMVEDPLDIDESDPYFYPHLQKTIKDPAGHRSGFVAVVGKANAGKSTFLNALLGEKLAIVTPKAQTTRHRLQGILSGPHFQMVITDTPGVLSRENNILDRKMRRNVVRAVKDCDVLLIIVDAARKPKEALAAFQPGA